VFPTYFRLSVPESGVSRLELQEVLALTPDRAAFAGAMRELARSRRPDGQSRVRPVLERLGDFAEKDVPQEDIHEVVGAFCDSGDEIMAADDVEGRFLEIPNEMLIWWVVKKLLGRLESQERVRVLKQEMGGGEALRTIVLTLTALSEEHGGSGDAHALPADRRLVDPDSLEELKEIVVERLRQTDVEKLLSRPAAIRILYRWGDWATKGEVKARIAGLMSSDRLILLMLRQLVRKVHETNLGTGVQTTELQVAASDLDRFFDRETLSKRLAELEQVKDLSEADRELVRMAQASLAGQER